MSSSKKEEERNEKIIRGLLKLPPNRKCINCNSPGPQYVCTNFWTFICVTCSGIHREFTHRVKSVSMAKFTTQEVEALQRGGNQRAREIFFDDCNKELNMLSDNSNIDKIREFIKNVYVDKKYAGGRSFDKPPRDVQSQKNHDDLRRASSYHAFSQSPPYDGQYEERRYGKQSAKLSRKPGSDRGHYEGKISNILYSPSHQDDQLFEDKFVGENSGFRISGCSNSSRGEVFGTDNLSPKPEAAVYGSSTSKQVREILPESLMPEAFGKSFEKNHKGDTVLPPHPKRTTSSGSFGSFDSNSASLVSANSDSLIDAFIEPEPSSKEQLKSTSTPAEISSSGTYSDKDPFNILVVPQRNSSSPSSVDLFGISHTLSTSSSEQTNPFSESVGWATFDLPEQSGADKIDRGHIPVTFPNGNQFTTFNNSDWLASLMVDNQHEVAQAADMSNFPQLWNAFEDSIIGVSQTSSAFAQEKSNEHILSHKPSTHNNLCAVTDSQELATADRCLEFGIDEFAASSLPSDSSAGSSFPYPFLQFEEGNREGNAQENKPINPFDPPFDSYQEVGNVHLEMCSLKEALPNPSCPTDVIGDVPDRWFVESPFKPCAPSIPHGELPYTFGQVPSSPFWDITPQDAVVATCTNPFA